MSDHEQHAWALLGAAALVFALLSALFAGHIVKQAAIIWQYRA